MCLLILVTCISLIGFYLLLLLFIVYFELFLPIDLMLFVGSCWYLLWFVILRVRDCGDYCLFINVFVVAFALFPVGLVLRLVVCFILVFVWLRGCFWLLVICCGLFVICSYDLPFFVIDIDLLILFMFWWCCLYIWFVYFWDTLLVGLLLPDYFVLAGYCYCVCFLVDLVLY